MTLDESSNNKENPVDGELPEWLAFLTPKKKPPENPFVRRDDGGIKLFNLGPPKPDPHVISGTHREGNLKSIAEADLDLVQEISPEKPSRIQKEPQESGDIPALKTVALAEEESTKSLLPLWAWFCILAAVLLVAFVSVPSAGRIVLPIESPESEARKLTAPKPLSVQFPPPPPISIVKATAEAPARSIPSSSSPMVSIPIDPVPVTSTLLSKAIASFSPSAGPRFEDLSGPCQVWWKIVVDRQCRKKWNKARSVGFKVRSVDLNLALLEEDLDCHLWSRECRRKKRALHSIGMTTSR